MRSRLPLLILFLAVRSTLCAQGFAPYRLDTVASVGFYRSSCATADGGCAFLYQSPVGEVLWRADGYGVPQWARLLDSTLHAPRLTAKADGGLLIAEDLGTVTIHNGTIADTAIFHLAVTSLNNDGGQAWRRTMTFKLYSEDLLPFQMRDINAMENANGDVFVHVLCDLNTSFAEYSYLFKFDSGGNLQWARNLGANHSDFHDGVLFFWSVGGVAFTPDAVGGGYFISPDAPQHGQMFRLTPAGDIQWNTGYTYVNVGTFDFQHVAIDANGNPLALGGTQGPTTVMFDPTSGQMLSADLYGTGWGSFSHAVIVGANHLVLIGAQWTEVDDQGAVIHSMDYTSVSVPPYTYTFSPQVTGYAGGRLIMPGGFTSHHQIFGYTQNYMAAWSVDMANIDECLNVPYTMPHYEIPDTIMIATPNDTGFTTLPAVVTVLPSPFSSTNITPMGVVDACSMMVGIAELENANTLSIHPSPIASGNSATLNLDDVDLATRIECVASDGRVVSTLAEPAHQRQVEINTSGFAPGLYLLRATDGGGQVRGMCRLMVE